MPPHPEKQPSSNAERRQWFVRMSNGSTFGPIHTRGLALWAEEGRIMPDDEVSQDRTHWVAAQTIGELQMNVLIERPDGSWLGPFHEKAIQPLVAEGRIPPNARTVHRDQLPEHRAQRQMALFASPEVDAPDDAPGGPPERHASTAAKGASRTELRRRQARIDELERSLEEARTRLADAESLHARECETLRASLEQTARELTAATQERDARIERPQAELEAARETPPPAEVPAETVTALEETVRELTAATQERDTRIERLQAELEAARETPPPAEVPAETVAALAAERDREIERREALETEYQELLAFSNERDAELKAQLVALRESSRPAADGSRAADARRIRQYEDQIVALRAELNVQREQLVRSEAEVQHASRPNEPEIARIERFAETALTTLQAVLERNKTTHEQLRAAATANQELLHADIERLQRALNLAPDELTRVQQMERRNDLLIVKLRQELEASRRLHQTELNQAGERQRELEQRAAAMEKREWAAREALARAEQRADGHSSLEMQLRRRENALLAVEREFETARQKWQEVENRLMNRINELESGASRLLNDNDTGAPAALPSTPQRPTTFQAAPWMKLKK